jgi:hypothetical protein
LSELVIDQRQKLVRRVFIAGFDLGQDAGDIRHGLILVASQRVEQLISVQVNGLESDRPTRPWLTSLNGAREDCQFVYLNAALPASVETTAGNSTVSFVQSVHRPMSFLSDRGLRTLIRIWLP